MERISEILDRAGPERVEWMRQTLALKDRMAPEQWEQISIVNTLLGVDYAIEHAKGETLPHPNRVFDKPGREYQILRGFYEIEFDLQRDRERLKEIGLEGLPTSHLERKTKYFRNLVKEIRTRRHHYLIPRLYEKLLGGDAPALPVVVVVVNLVALWELVSQPDRLLVGVKDGVYWKKIKWPEIEDKDDAGIQEGRNVAWLECYFQNLSKIGSRELAIVPEQVIDPRKIEGLNIPKSDKTTEELLQDAFYNQRYIVPHQGASIILRNFGDLRKMTLLESRSEIWALVATDEGEFQLGINLDTAAGWLKPKDDNLSEDREAELINKLADVYNTVVTAVEIPDEELETQISTRREVRDQERKGRSRAVYIPRIIRADRKAEIRAPYEGPKRPTTPHQVQGHRRRANMTERHRQAILKFEHEHGISILRNLPAGYTFVRPFVVPKDAEMSMRDLPTFIRRRIERKLAQELQRPSIEPQD